MWGGDTMVGASRVPLCGVKQSRMRWRLNNDPFRTCLNPL
jgi:hypothetical protein